MKLHLVREHNDTPLSCSPITITPRCTILELKKLIADDTCDDVENIQLQRKDPEDEVWPDDDNLPLQKDGQGLRDEETLRVVLPVAASDKIFLWNGSKEPLFAVLSYDMRDLDQTRAVNVNVAGGIDLAAGANAAVHVEQKGRKYVMKTGEYKTKLFPHKRTKIPIASTLDKRIIQVIITTDENEVVDEFTAQPGNSKIISKMNTTYMSENSRKRARGWGFKVWMPEEGDSKDPHKDLEQGEDCKICLHRMPSTSCY